MWSPTPGTPGTATPVRYLSSDGFTAAAAMHQSHGGGFSPFNVVDDTNYAGAPFRVHHSPAAAATAGWCTPPTCSTAFYPGGGNSPTVQLVVNLVRPSASTPCFTQQQQQQLLQAQNQQPVDEQIVIQQGPATTVYSTWNAAAAGTAAGRPVLQAQYNSGCTQGQNAAAGVYFADDPASGVVIRQPQVFDDVDDDGQGDRVDDDDEAAYGDDDDDDDVDSGGASGYDWGQTYVRLRRASAMM